MDLLLKGELVKYMPWGAQVAGQRFDSVVLTRADFNILQHWPATLVKDYLGSLADCNQGPVETTPADPAQELAADPVVDDEVPLKDYRRSDNVNRSNEELVCEALFHLASLRTPGSQIPVDRLVRLTAAAVNELRYRLGGDKSPADEPEPVSVTWLQGQLAAQEELNRRQRKELAEARKEQDMLTAQNQTQEENVEILTVQVNQLRKRLRDIHHSNASLSFNEADSKTLSWLRVNGAALEAMLERYQAEAEEQKQVAAEAAQGCLDGDVVGFRPRPDRTPPHAIAAELNDLVQAMVGTSVFGKSHRQQLAWESHDRIKQLVSLCEKYYEL